MPLSVAHSQTGTLVSLERTATTYNNIIVLLARLTITASKASAGVVTAMAEYHCQPTVFINSSPSRALNELPNPKNICKVNPSVTHKRRILSAIAVVRTVYPLYFDFQEQYYFISSIRSHGYYFFHLARTVATIRGRPQ